MGIVTLGGFSPQPSTAVDLTGTVHFEGMIVFEDPNIGLNPDDLTVSIKPDVAAGGGVKCDLGTTTSDIPDPNGAYPDAGAVSAEITMSKGNEIPADAVCAVTVRASGSDGSAVTGRGSTTVIVDPNDLGSSATITGVDIVVRQTKALAGMTKDCWKWMKKQHKKRAKCNFLILKKGGPDAAPKCKDACYPDPGPCEPTDCDPYNLIEEALAFSHGGNDQQTDAASGLGVDYRPNPQGVKEQVKCQKHLGFAAANYLKKRNKRVWVKCIEDGIDSEECRAQQSQDSKRTLERIGKCEGARTVDPNSLLTVPDVESPCSSCFNGADGTVDAKCMKACFQSVLDDYSDMILGEIPECGNGIVQPPETCDDGNTASGDDCNEFCRIEPGP
jgi:cysteine-rich repeat protein